MEDSPRGQQKSCYYRKSNTPQSKEGERTRALTDAQRPWFRMRRRFLKILVSEE